LAKWFRKIDRIENYINDMNGIANPRKKQLAQPFETAALPVNIMSSIAPNQRKRIAIE
jgi:hypothetical protein